VETLATLLIAGAITAFFLRGYLKRQQIVEQRPREAASRGQIHTDGPQSQHPHIDADHCIGCAACTSVCPEGDVLATLGGKAVIVDGHKCIGHGLCADACPVGAITMVMGNPRLSENMPYLTADYETSVKNLFIAGELGGLALIKNAVNQGRACIDMIADRIKKTGATPAQTYDVVIVGAGPAGISASLRAVERGLRYLTIEQDDVGGTVLKYPRQKLVMTSPVEFPLYGRFKQTELSKEALLAFWQKVLSRADFNVRTGEKVQDVRKDGHGSFSITTPVGEYRSHAVVLGLGKGGSPRKLGVTGEGLPKVMYRLIETDHYINKNILVVGGGDSAVEAAMGLAEQSGNRTTLSYRQQAFSRIKERNAQRLEKAVRGGKIDVVFNSMPIEFTPDAAVLDVQGQRRRIPNDFVWIFAGGDPPHKFLKRIGVGFGTLDMTAQGTRNR
jgi:thioredoxin reductase/ferredoxin